MESKAENRPEIPVLTAASPPITSSLRAVGCVAARGEWNLDFESAVPDLAVKLAREARKQFPCARALYNFKFTDTGRHYGHTWYEGTADVYEYPDTRE